MKSKFLTITLCTLCFTTTIFRQQPAKKDVKKAKQVVQNQTEIYKEIFKADSVFFQAFNTCDSITYRTYLTDELEFYHHLNGIHLLPTEMQSIREMCAMNNHFRRELLKGTLEVYKLRDFEAVEIGIYRIYHTNPGQTEHISGDYKFIHVWQQKDGFWKLKRIISYGPDKMNNN